jgi:hypothetical protein
MRQPMFDPDIMMFFLRLLCCSEGKCLNLQIKAKMNTTRRIVSLAAQDNVINYDLLLLLPKNPLEASIILASDSYQD